jgi:hemoglobin/transferrin/lactoferrin receptor protein
LKNFYDNDSVSVTYPSYEPVFYSVEDLKQTVWIELSEMKLEFSGIKVSANRWKQDKSEVPGRISNIRMRDLDMQSPQTAADLLESSGYVFVQKSQLAGGSPQLRGFGTNRVMIVVDGVRMNNAIFRSGNLQNVISIDANALDEVEVLFGPGAVTYGSDAIGGVMDFTTKKARFSPDSVRRFTQTNVFSRYSSTSNEMTGHADFNFGTKKFASYTAISFSQFDDLKSGKFGDDDLLRPTYQDNGLTRINPNPRDQIHTGYNQLNLLQKLSFQASDNVKLDYGLTYATNLSDAPRYDRLTLDNDSDGNLDYGEWYYGPQKWMMQRLGLNVSKKTWFFDEFKAIAAYQNFQESRNDRKYKSDNIRRQFEQVDAFSVNIDFDKAIRPRSELFYGLEGVFNLVKSAAFRDYDSDSTVTINSRYPNGAVWQSYGAYISLKQFLSDDWILNVGARYSHYSIQADFDTALFHYPIASTTNSNGAMNGSLGLVYRHTKNAHYYLNGSSGFRAPNIDDIGKVFESAPGSVVVPNTNLKPEHAYNVELGFVHALKGKVKLDGAVYYTYLKNALARANTSFQGSDSILYDGLMSQVQAIQNMSSAHVYGVQAGLEVSLAKGISVFSSFSYQKGYEWNIDSSMFFPKSHVAPIFGRTALRYYRPQLKMEFYAVYHSKVANNELPLNERNDASYARDENGLSYAPAWYTLNFKASYFFNKHLALNVGVENITNVLYRSLGSGVSAPGFNLIFSLKATF